MISIDRWLAYLGLTSVRPADFDTIRLWVFTKPKMNRVRMLGSITVAGDELTGGDSEIRVESDSRADRRKAAALFPQANTNPGAGVGKGAPENF